MTLNFSTIKRVPLLLCLLAIISCVDNLDFEQTKEYKLTPQYTSSLTYFTISPKQFFNEAGNQETQLVDTSAFTAFENVFVKDNLVKLDFNVEIKNEFDNSFNIQVDFLDADNQITYRFQELNIAANNLDYKFEETVLVSNNSAIKNTTKVFVTISLGNATTMLDKEDPSEFQFKSSFSIYIDKAI